MSWKPLTDDERKFCQYFIKWLEVRRDWYTGAVPSDIDCYKSALLERLRNGLEPLDFPPPKGYSCPWYALVEDRGPHLAIYSTDISFAFKKFPHFPNVDIWILQSPYKRVKKLTNVKRPYDTEYIIQDLGHGDDSPYRFRLWYDPDYKYGSIAVEPQKGAWLIQNEEFYNG